MCARWLSGAEIKILTFVREQYSTAQVLSRAGQIEFVLARVQIVSPTLSFNRVSTEPCPKLVSRTQLYLSLSLSLSLSDNDKGVAVLCWNRSGCCYPSRLRGCENRPAPFPGRMLYKATKQALSVCPCLCLYFMSVSVVLLTRAPFCVALFCVICAFCLLVVLVRLSVPVQVTHSVTSCSNDV